MSDHEKTTPFSMLWPDGAPAREQPDLQLSEQTLHDLGLDSLVTKITRSALERQEFEKILLHPSDDPRVITYRQEILADLLARPRMVAGLQELLPLLEGLTVHYFQRGMLYEKSSLSEVTWRLGELESIVTCVHRLQQLLADEKQPLQAAGWLALAARIAEIAADPAFVQMEKELPDLLDRVRQTKSVTIGVNLDHNLLPVQATLLGIHRTPFSGIGFLGRIFGGQSGGGQGIAPLHDLLANSRAANPLSPLSAAHMEVSPLMVPLFRDLGDVLNKVARSISRALSDYRRVHGRLFANLWSELLFFLTAVRLVRRMEAYRLPMCRPQIRPKAERIAVIQDHYNINLALQLAIGYTEIDLRPVIVEHQLQMKAGSEIQILTGPNGGGKTTYLQAVGLTQVLAQAGLFVPGRQAEISPVDRVFTHFPVAEKLERGTGRFGDEAQRLREIFHDLTPYSLVLLNESLASTNTGESLYLAQDLVRLFCQVGVRAIFATHMHELAAMAPQINESATGISLVISMVASRIEPGGETAVPATSRSYRILPGPPLGHSYARELAAQYGISFDQLQRHLQGRGLLPAAPG